MSQLVKWPYVREDVQRIISLANRVTATKLATSTKIAASTITRSANVCKILTIHDVRAGKLP